MAQTTRWLEYFVGSCSTTAPAEGAGGQGDPIVGFSAPVPSLSPEWAVGQATGMSHAELLHFAAHVKYHQAILSVKQHDLATATDLLAQALSHRLAAQELELQANSWTRWSTQQLFKLGSVVRPLRTVKEKERYEAELASQLAGVSVHDMSEDDSIGRESDEDGDQWDDDDGMWE
jgi:hypothetical protein